MNDSALIFLLVTWSVISFFCFKFFIKVVRTPPRPGDDDD